MSEFELKGETWRIDRMDAMQQFHLTRKLAPVIPALLPLFAFASDGRLKEMFADRSSEAELEPPAADPGAEGTPNWLTGGVADELAKAAEPFAKALAEMPDDHAEYVINACMQMVSQKTGKGWVRIWSKVGTHNDEIGLDVVLMLSVRVLRENLGAFMPGLATSRIASPTSR